MFSRSRRISSRSWQESQYIKQVSLHVEQESQYIEQVSLHVESQYVHIKMPACFISLQAVNAPGLAFSVMYSRSDNLDCDWTKVFLCIELRPFLLGSGSEVLLGSGSGASGLVKATHGICLDASQRSKNGGKVHMWACNTNNQNQQVRFSSNNQQTLFSYFVLACSGHILHPQSS